LCKVVVNGSKSRRNWNNIDFNACAPFFSASGGFQRVFPPLDPFLIGAALDRAPSRPATTLWRIGDGPLFGISIPWVLSHPSHASATTALPPVMVERKESQRYETHAD